MQSQRTDFGFRFFAAAMLGGVLLSGASQAQDLPRYEIAGFRDARFGMTEREVRATAAKAFDLKTSDIATSANQIEGTHVLTAKLAKLDPGPGPATVSYIFGHGSKRLIQVNVIWGADTAAQSVDAIVAAGSRLQRYFSGYAWRKDGAHAGVPVGDNTVVLFAGEDDKTGAVRVVVDGVKYQMQRDGKQATSPEPKGPPRLVISYIANRGDPDIAKIEKGKF